jgi:outer membrane murein-binding lipoprotein Lpp
MKYLASARRNRFGIIAACICSVALLGGLSACSKQDLRQSARNLRKSLAKLTAGSDQSTEPVQPAQPEPAKKAKAAKPASRAKAAEPVAKAAQPLPEPTQAELVEYLHGKLLALSPSDGFNDNLEVTFDPSTTALTVSRPGGRCENFLNTLDANSIVWDLFDPGDTHNLREQLLRLTVSSMSGKAARTCYIAENHLDPDVNPNRARFLFSTSKASEFPAFQDDMTKAFKKLIALSGGVPEKNLFPERGRDRRP